MRAVARAMISGDAGVMYRLRDHRQPARSLGEAISDLTADLKAELARAGVPLHRRTAIIERLILLQEIAEALDQTNRLQPRFTAGRYRSKPCR